MTTYIIRDLENRETRVQADCYSVDIYGTLRILTRERRAGYVYWATTSGPHARGWWKSVHDVNGVRLAEADDLDELETPD